MIKLSMERAIRRMSFDYERKEEDLKEKYNIMAKREGNMEKFKINLITSEGLRDITVQNADNKEDESDNNQL